MGQRLQSISKPSFLLHQLIHPYQDLEQEDYEGQEEDEDEDEDQDGMGSSESSESEILNLEEELDGVLREEVVAEALSQLGRSGSGTEHVYLNLTLSGGDLVDISILCGYVHLQKLDISVNKIEDLCCVGYMPYLLELNASQNKLTTFFNFKPPKNLKKVDFSCNQISKMCDLSAYQALTKLILDSNNIEEISGIELCSSLTHLSLAHNKITTIAGLGMLPIKVLCLSHNQIEKITGLDSLRSLQIVDLSHNMISSLQGLEDHSFLEVIILEQNKVAELEELEYIENLPLLRVLNLLRNPIQENSEYWFFIIFMLLRLTELDQKKIKVEEKVASINKYNPPPEVIAAQDHLTHVVNSMMQPQRIFDSTLPSLDTPYPMLVLAGPEACGKRELAHRLCKELSAYFRYGACHTTRPPYFGEGDRVDYHFVSQDVFNEMVNMGKFILTYNYGNHSYGLSRDTIEGIARDGLASCVHMEIEGVRSLKHTYFEPRYILVLPMNKKQYDGYLRRKGLFSRVEIEFAVSRVDHYVEVNQKYPGYFDAIINADDLDDAYKQMSQLVKGYLGLCQETAKSLAPPTDFNISQLKYQDSPKKASLSSYDFLDSTDRNYLVQLWAKRSARKSQVERNSMERQYETARQALLGKIPAHHTLLFQRGSVPAPVSSVHYFTCLDPQKSFELFGDSSKTPIGTYPEKRHKVSHAFMKHSSLFQSRSWSKDLPFTLPKYSVCLQPGTEVSDDKEDRGLKDLRHRVYTLQQMFYPRLLHLAVQEPRMKRPSRHAAPYFSALQKSLLQHEKRAVQHKQQMLSCIVRPSSNTKPTIPPIPQSGKYTPR